MILRILLGCAMVGIGFLFVWQSEWLLYNIGRVDWAEQNLGNSGGSRIFYKLLGILIILIGFSVMTNLYTSILESFVSLLVPGA